ncbi:MAG: ABC transporter ATP-binding protein [Kamptonema sp. SIO4C4]|nr:ABC transporter ATP-binding protein [Kamptonema sp. SIO4C4]
MTHDEEVALAVSDLSFAYSPQSPTWQNLNFRLSAGERVGLVGPNGAGKTTLFLTLCGIFPPQSGEIRIFGQGVEVGKFYPQVGLVFQNPDDQLFCPSVWDDVAFGAENMGCSPVEVQQRVQEALSIAGVSHLQNRVPHELSGGEKCMIAIAAVLAMRPHLILYDEPSANLDLRARRRLICFLQESSQTTLISSHDLELVLEVCDRVLLLNHGQIIADGHPKEILGDRQLMESNGLECPYSITVNS